MSRSDFFEYEDLKKREVESMTNYESGGFNFNSKQMHCYE